MSSNKSSDLNIDLVGIHRIDWQPLFFELCGVDGMRSVFADVGG